MRSLNKKWDAPKDYLLRDGDFLISRSGTIGRAFVYSSHNGLCSYAGYLVRFIFDSQQVPQYYFYITKSSQFYLWLKMVAIESTIGNVNGEKYANMLLPNPCLVEQQKIVDYLERETEKIDALIAAKKRLLELLAEKRRSMITHAVTRGLTDDVSMKDSGVEWLGEIPKHWDALPLKLLCESLQTGPFGTQLHAEDYIENGIPSINPAHLSNGKIVPDLKVSVDEDTVERLAIHKFKLGDIVFARRGEIGRCGLVTQQEVGWLCGSGSLRARPHKNLLNPEYLVRVMLNTFASNWLSIMSVGTTMENLNTEIIGALSIPVPPLNEQNQICNKIEKQIISLDLLSETTKNTVSLLQERRTSLISAAVAGQIRIAD